MKTKISHLGRSSVSVILAVMMLLSTMLIGTVSTVNAVTGTVTVYFKNTVNWDNVYAYFYGGSYWNDTQGSGSMNIAGGPIKMTKVDGTDDIYSCTYTGTYSQYISFTRDPQSGYNNFNNTQAVYRGDFDSSKSLFTPDTTKTNTLNETVYYNNGTWSTYSGGSGGSTTESGFALTGALANNTTTYADGTKFTKEDGSTNNYSLTVSVTDNNNNSFRIIGATGDNYYGAYTETYQIDNGSHSSSDKTYGTQNNGSYNGNFYFGKLGTYKIHIIDNSYGNIGVWVESVSATTYTVNYEVKGGNGNLTATGAGVTGSGSDVVNSGTKVTFTAAPNEGYAVEGWYSDADCKNAITGSGTNTSYEVTVNANTNVYVKFKSTTIDPEYRLTGDLSAIDGWKGYSEALKFDTVETDGSYSKIITVTDDDVNNKFFKLIKSENGSDKYYGPYWTNDNKENIDICGFKAGNAYDTYENGVSAFKFSKAGTYKIHYIVKTDKSTPSVWVEENTTKYNVIVADSIKSIASVNKTKAAKDEEVTVTATSIPQGKILDKVTVKGADNAQVTTTVSGNTATFTMPDHDVTVTGVTFRDAETYTVEFSSINETFGTVSAKKGTTSLTSGDTVTEGDEVTFTATHKEGYTFTGWTVNGTSVSSTTNPYKITVNSNTTVVANFKEMTGTKSDYYLLCGEDATFQTGNYTPVPLYTNEEGVYYADFDAANITKSKNYFIIFSTKEDTSGIIVDSNNVTVNAVDKNGFSLSDYNENVQNPNGGSNNVKFAKVYINKDEVTGFTIKITNLNVNSKKITYSAEPKFKEAPKNAVNIIAKNGTQTAKFQSMGTTEITKVDDVVFDIGNYNDYTKKATAIKGNKVTVTTTVADAYKDTYYVKGFVVNGESYGIQSGPNDDGVYTLEYQIPDDVADGTNFEITPVYFLKDSRNCVTFYVEGFDGAVQDSWGNTIACYPYYEGQSGTTNNNAFGEYPGQPLLYEGGKYYTQIPKSITLDSSEKKIVGMTLNNFALETVHGAISKIKENKQSYDYDDFVRIANNNYGNNIIYTFKYSTVKDNFGTETNSPATITREDFDSPTGNGWEDLTDYNHRKVDLFGNVLTGADSEGEPLLVVSNGYFENYQGYYATEWTVYKKLDDDTYSKIAQIPSSALLLKSKADLTNSTSDEKYMNSLKSYADAYETLKAYKNTPAQITFESSIKRGFSLQNHSNVEGTVGESAERVDGRWYYSMIGEKITAKIAVEYGDTATSSFTKDPFEGDTNKTTTIGAHAYFTNDAAYGKTTYKSNIDSSNYFTFTADTIATDEKGQNYVFLGWYLLSDDKYTKLTDAKAPMTGSDTFVARYVKAPAGTVTIDHRLFSAASNPTPNPTPGTGSGKCYVSVKVLDEDNNLIKEFAKTENSITLDKTYIDSSKNYKLEITLTTVTSGQDEFQKFYYLAKDKKTYESIGTGTTTEGKVTTVTREVDILESFFNRNDDGTYTFMNKTGSDSIHYYSDITETKIPYKITFNYEPRLESDAKQYVVTGEFTSEYILKYGANLTPEFVMSVAPYEDNFFNTIKWDKDNITFGDTGDTKTAVVNSTTSSRTVTVTALNPDGTLIEAYKLNNVPEYTSTVVYGSLLTYKKLYGLTEDQKTEIADGKEYIYVAKPEYDGKKFSYWQISTSLKKDDKSAYVTKCFSREFNYIAYNDYYIWPVYGDSQSITGASTTLNFLDYSRNQSTDENGDHKTDRVFADFALAFDSNGIQLQTYKGTNIKVGMFLEVCGDLETDSNGDVITDIDHYKNMPEYSTSNADLENIKTAILNNRDKKNVTYTTADGKNRWLLNKPIDIKSLDNKNRIEYYVGYNNTDNNQKKLMRAYSYVIVDNEITLCSTPYSFVNYYKVGNKTYTVS